MVFFVGFPGGNYSFLGHTKNYGPSPCAAHRPSSVSTGILVEILSSNPRTGKETYCLLFTATISHSRKKDRHKRLTRRPVLKNSVSCFHSSFQVVMHVTMKQPSSWIRRCHIYCFEYTREYVVNVVEMCSARSLKENI